MSLTIAYLWRVCHSLNLSVLGNNLCPNGHKMEAGGSADAVASFRRSPKRAPPSRRHRGSGWQICSGGLMIGPQNEKAHSEQGAPRLPTMVRRVLSALQPHAACLIARWEEKAEMVWFYEGKLNPFVSARQIRFYGVSKQAPGLTVKAS